MQMTAGSSKRQLQAYSLQATKLQAPSYNKARLVPGLCCFCCLGKNGSELPPSHLPAGDRNYKVSHFKDL